MDWEKFLFTIVGIAFGALAIFLVIFLVIALVSLPVTIRTEKACFAAGYADSRVVWWMNSYCIEWEDANQRSIPLEEVLNGRGP